jgi:hypothetical protein
MDHSDGSTCSPGDCPVAAKIQMSNTEDKMQIRNWTIGRRVDKCEITYFHLVLFYLLSLTTAVQAQSSSVQTDQLGLKPPFMTSQWLELSGS